MMANWIFPLNNFGQINGIADSGVETFRGTPIKSLAREICQNSLDAKLQNDQPVKVVFSTFQVATIQVPGIDDLKGAFVKALDFWRLQSSDKAKKFFNEAIGASNQPTITCLRISDFNTTGLTGSDAAYNSPWCNLIKSTGASDKSESSGGSFGIGKFAPYACSSFRTVFYSTCDKDGHAAYQGVSRLTSFKMDSSDDSITQGVGYYGGEKCTPIFKSYSLDPAFARDNSTSGTDIFVVGFSHDDAWKKELIASVLDSFLLAVFNGNLIVEVDDIVIDAHTLPQLIPAYTDDFNENADKYYQVLTADEAIAKSFDADIFGMGKVTLRMMIEPGMHRKCAMVRKTGMKIMDRGGISSTIPFSGVLFIEGEELNAFLRSLENPQHTKWEPDRSDNKSYARKVIAQINKFISDSLMNMQELDTRNAIDPSVGEFLAFIDEKEKEDSKNQDRQEAISDKFKRTEIKPTPVKVPANSNMGQEGNNEDTRDDDNGDIIEEGPPGEGSGGQNGNGEGGGGGGGQFAGGGNGPHEGEQVGPNPIEHRMSAVHVKPASERQMCLDKAKGKYLIIFKPSVSASDGSMKIYQSAESQSYDAVITGVECNQSGVTFSGNEIKGLTFTANQAVRITVSLDYQDYSALEVKAYGHQV